MLALWGLSDPWIIAVYLACILSAALCFVYGLVTWGMGKKEEDVPKATDREWAAEEDKITEEL